jgi:hypothetical protein
MVIETFDLILDTVFMITPLNITVTIIGIFIVTVILLHLFYKQKKFIYQKKEDQFHKPPSNTSLSLIRKPPSKLYLIHEI